MLRCQVSRCPPLCYMVPRCQVSHCLLLRSGATLSGSQCQDSRFQRSHLLVFLMDELLHWNIALSFAQLSFTICRMCFVAALSSSDVSAGRITQGGAVSFKTHSTHCSPDDFQQSRQPSYLAAVVGNSEASHNKASNCSISVPGNCSSPNTSQDLPHSISHIRQVAEKENHRINKQCPGSLKNQMQMVNCEGSAKLFFQSFGDLDQWLQNGEDDSSARNYIDRRVVESVLKCRQFHRQSPKQFAEKSSSQTLSSRCVTNRLADTEAGQQGLQCRPSVTDTLYPEDFGAGKLETEVDGDSGFSGDRNSASSTSSGLSVESSLTSLGSATDLWSSGNQSNSSGSATSILSSDQSLIQSSPPTIPDPRPPVASSFTNISSSSLPEAIRPDVQSNRLVSEKIYATLSRHKIVEASSRSRHPSDVSSFCNQEALQPATNSGWCISDKI